MKRITALFAALLMLSATACSDKKDTESGESPASPAVTDAADMENIEITTKAEESAETTVSITAAENSTETETTAETSEGLTFPEDDPEFEEKLDDEVIAAAQLLFEKACETEWKFTVGSPYSLDTSEYITNEYDWQYCLVTDEGINSLDDVRADFHRVFSESYEDTLDELFREKDGRVYCLNGARGSDIFYESSEITEITGRSDGEIRFKVVSYYNGENFGIESYIKETEFVIVRESNRAWRVSEFKLPY